MSAVNIHRDLHIIVQWDILARFFLRSNRSVAHQNRFDDNNFNRRGAYTFKLRGEQKKFIPVPINCGVYVCVRRVWVFLCVCMYIIYVPALTRILRVEIEKKTIHTSKRAYYYYYVKFPSLCSKFRFVLRCAIYNIIIYYREPAADAAAVHSLQFCQSQRWIFFYAWEGRRCRVLLKTRRIFIQCYPGNTTCYNSWYRGGHSSILSVYRWFLLRSSTCTSTIGRLVHFKFWLPKWVPQYLYNCWFA